MWQLERIEFSQSREFWFLFEKNKKDEKDEDKEFYFVNDLGKRVLTDQVGKAIWEALPGTGARICERVSKRWLVSKRLVYEFLYVLGCAGIIRPSKPFQPPENLEKKGSLNEEVEDAPQDLVSVIVVTFNGKDYIKTCLESVFRQSYQNLEVICVDNHSTDGTLSIIKENFPQVRLISLRRNRHYAGGINQGLKQAQGRYFLILNQDTELDKDCVKRLVRKARSLPEAGAVVPMMKFARLRNFINGIGNQVNNKGWGTDNFIYCADIGQFKDLKEVPSACFGAVMLNREAVEEVGLVDGAYGSFYEDTDWSLRCWFQGWKVVPETQAVVYHEFGGSYPEGKKLFFAARNRLRLVLKLFKGRVMLGFLKNYMREDFRCGLSFLKKADLRSLWIYGKAYLSLFFHLLEIMLKRWKILRTKVRGMRERTVLKKNPSFYCCLKSELRMPEIDAAAIRRYYRWHLLKLKNSSSGSSWDASPKDKEVTL